MPWAIDELKSFKVVCARTYAIPRKLQPRNRPMILLALRITGFSLRSSFSYCVWIQDAVNGVVVWFAEEINLILHNYHCQTYFHRAS